MLVFFKPNLALFAVTKTGSTAYHMALRSQAEICLVKLAAAKHISVRKYQEHMQPFLQGAFGINPERVAVIRDPLDWTRSWYSYRRRDIHQMPAQRHKNSTANVSFEEFIEEALKPKPHNFARIGSQYKFLTMDDGAVGVDHLFTYDNMDMFHGFLEDRLGFEFSTDQKNVSPDVPADLSPALMAKFRDARKKEFGLYDRVQAAGGYLKTEIPR